MDVNAPFTGTLVIPDKVMPGDSPVSLPDGQIVAQIRRPMFALRSAFDVLTVDGMAVAHGAARGFFRRRYALTSPDGATLLELTLSWSGTSGRSTVTVPGGKQLSAKGSWWTDRRYAILDGDAEVAGISPTTSSFSLRPDSYAFELHQPMFSIVQAVGLAQCLRAAAKSARSASSAQTHHHNP